VACGLLANWKSGCNAGSAIKPLQGWRLACKLAAVGQGWRQTAVQELWYEGGAATGTSSRLGWVCWCSWIRTVCKIIEGVAGQTRQGAGHHQPISAASQQERTGGIILCCILLPLRSYMVCVPSSRVLSLNSSTLLSVPDDWRVNASCTAVLLLVRRASCGLFHNYYVFYIDCPSLQTIMPYPYFA
jgi:hypothetical protein